MIHDLHAFCCQLAPSVWFWELWHSGSCEWNSNNVIVDVTDTPDDAGTVWKSGPRHTVQHGVIWSARKHDKNSFIKPPYCLLITIKFKEPQQWLAHSFKCTLLVPSTKLLYNNWIAGFGAWRVKDNSSQASLAGCQWRMQSGPLSSRLSPYQTPHQERQPPLLWWICHSSPCLPSAGVQVLTTNNMLQS